MARFTMTAEQEAALDAAEVAREREAAALVESQTVWESEIDMDAYARLRITWQNAVEERTQIAYQGGASVKRRRDAQRAVIQASNALDALTRLADIRKGYRDADIHTAYLAEVRALGFRG